MYRLKRFDKRRQIALYENKDGVPVAIRTEDPALTPELIAELDRRLAPNVPVPKGKKYKPMPIARFKKNGGRYEHIPDKH